MPGNASDALTAGKLNRSAKASVSVGTASTVRPCPAKSIVLRLNEPSMDWIVVVAAVNPAATSDPPVSADSPPIVVTERLAPDHAALTE